MAIFAYVIAPDNSVFGNRQIIELSSLPPKTNFTLLKIPLQNNDKQSNFAFLNGHSPTNKFIPINDYTAKGDTLVVNKYISEDTSTLAAYTLADLNVTNFENAIVNKTFVLGTDKLGRDIFSRLIIGTRVSLMVGFIAVIISLFLGIMLGLFAGYFGGWVDAAIMWLINVVWSIPTILLVFAFTILLGKGAWQVFIAVGLTMWVNVARLVRGQVLEIKNLQYIEAAKILGFSHLRIMLKHILPNIVGPIMVMAAANFATAIVLEAGLSFLGIGVQAPQPSWGLMIKENYNLIITNQAMLALAPGFAIMLLVLSFNMVGNGLRDALDVKG
jgi:ABC-type dipeptide/oligopeptide/nickel transport system permease subunit